MASQNYGFLEQTEEGKSTPSLSETAILTFADAHHRTRLSNVETRPFARISRRLLASESLIYTPPTSYPTPPPDASAADEEAASREVLREKQSEERRQWREEMMLDFLALEDSMVRIQLLRKSNEKERERYAAEKIKILETARTIKENTIELRTQLEEAQKTLALRKTYDELAEKITSNRMLKPRDDQRAALDRLNVEIAELERESRAYAQTWAERRVQFGKIVEEGRQMLMLIRNEKEEAERKEGMDQASSGEASRGATPTPDTGGETPLPPGQEADDGGVTPLRPLPNDLLAPAVASGRNSRSSSPARRSGEERPTTAASPRSCSGSRAASPAGSPSQREEGEDTEMGEIEDVPAVTAAEDVEEGEEQEDTVVEKMDET